MDFTASWPFTYFFKGETTAFAKEFSALLTGCGFLQTSARDARISITFVPTDELATSGLWSEPLLYWRGLSVRKRNERFFFSYRSWNLELDLKTAGFRCSGPDPEPGESLIFREFFLLSPILFLMRRFGYFEVHAAACAHDNFGYLFVGPSGCGKTTAVLSLISSGWKYLSDDAMLVSAGSEGGVLVRPLRRSFSLTPDHLTRYPELAGYATEPVPVTNKRRLDPRQVWPEQYVDAAKPKFIIACRVADAETTSIVPISPAESLAQLVAGSPWLMFDQTMAATHLEMFHSLAMTCRGFELRVGRDAFRNNDHIVSFIAPEVLARQCKPVSKEAAWA